MRLAVIGSAGQLGTDMIAIGEAARHTVVGLDIPAIDITDRKSTIERIGKLAPDAIINTAAFTAVDACEQKRDVAFAVNADGAGNVAAAAAACDAPVVHISTDYVFDGTGARPYVESDQPHPVSVYGQSKHEGELAVARETDRHWIVRIAWLYGQHGTNFVKTIRTVAARKAAAGEDLPVVNDQRGSPTWTVSICRQLLSLVRTDQYGIFHCTSEGACSWYDFAREIVQAAGIGVRVTPCGTGQFPRPAPRPANSVLENKRLKELGINCMPRWEDAFAAFCEQSPA
jgi:dTDP-4-dehydrorhamnose reductase